MLVTPAHQFPTGAVLSPERRRALLAWGGIVLEDDYDSEYRYDRAPVGTLQRLAPDRVVYLGTASKTLAPALRLGWLLAPKDLTEAIAQERWAVDSGGPAINARAYARLIATGEIDRHLRRTRREYRERRDAAGRGAHPSSSRAARSTASPPACTCCCDCRRARTRTRWWPDLAARRIRVNGLNTYRLAPKDEPALVIGYGRLSRPAIAGAVRSRRGDLVGRCRVAADLRRDQLDVVDVS